jgi:hypothetical protein
VGSHLPDYTASHFTELLFLVIKAPGFVLLYRNYRKSSETHGDQGNQEVATKTDIQYIFQLLHVPISEKQSYIANIGRQDVTRSVTILKILTLVLFSVVVPKYIGQIFTSHFL